MIAVLLNRLLQSAQIDLDYGIEWNRNSPINLTRIKEAINNGVNEISEGFGDGWVHPIKEGKDDNYHLSRIIYFINHPSEINGIEVDNKILTNKYPYSVSILSKAKVIDGHHRLLAAAYLGLETVKVKYSGRSDVLNYLTGETKTEPKDKEMIGKLIDYTENNEVLEKLKKKAASTKEFYTFKGYINEQITKQKSPRVFLIDSIDIEVRRTEEMISVRGI